MPCVRGYSPMKYNERIRSTFLISPAKNTSHVNNEKKRFRKWSKTMLKTHYSFVHFCTVWFWVTLKLCYVSLTQLTVVISTAIVEDYSSSPTHRLGQILETFHLWSMQPIRFSQRSWNMLHLLKCFGRFTAIPSNGRVWQQQETSSHFLKPHHMLQALEMKTGQRGTFGKRMLEHSSHHATEITEKKLFR